MKYLILLLCLFPLLTSAQNKNKIEIIFDTDGKIISKIPEKIWLGDIVTFTVKGTKNAENDSLFSKMQSNIQSTTTVFTSQDSLILENLKSENNSLYTVDCSFENQKNSTYTLVYDSTKKVYTTKDIIISETSSNIKFKLIERNLINEQIMETYENNIKNYHPLPLQKIQTQLIELKNIKTTRDSFIYKINVYKNTLEETIARLHLKNGIKGDCIDQSDSEKKCDFTKDEREKLLDNFVNLYVSAKRFEQFVNVIDTKQISDSISSLKDTIKSIAELNKNWMDSWIWLSGKPVIWPSRFILESKYATKISSLKYLMHSLEILIAQNNSPDKYEDVQSYQNLFNTYNDSIQKLENKYKAEYALFINEKALQQNTILYTGKLDISSIVNFNVTPIWMRHFDASNEFKSLSKIYQKAPSHHQLNICPLSWQKKYKNPYSNSEYPKNEIVNLLIHNKSPNDKIKITTTQKDTVVISELDALFDEVSKAFQKAISDNLKDIIPNISGALDIVDGLNKEVGGGGSDGRFVPVTVPINLESMEDVEKALKDIDRIVMKSDIVFKLLKLNEHIDYFNKKLELWKYQPVKGWKRTYDSIPNFETYTQETHLEPSSKAQLITHTLELTKAKDKKISFTDKYLLNKLHVWQLSAGLAFTPLTVKTTDIDKNGKVAFSEEFTYFILGLKLYPIKKMDTRYNKVFGPKWSSKINLNIHLTPITPLKNFFTGIGYDIIPGLNINGGVLWSRHFKVQMMNDEIINKSLSFKSYGYIALTLDVAAFSNLVKLFIK